MKFAAAFLLLSFAIFAEESKMEIKELKKQSTLVIKKKIKQGEIAAVLGEIFGKVMRHVTISGIKPLSAPFARYNMGEGDSFEIEAGVIVPEGSKGEGEIVAGDLPAGKTAFAVYTGPYDGLKGAHERLNAELKKQALKENGPRWEIYVNDPGDTKPEALKTEIYIAVKQEK